MSNQWLRKVGLIVSSGDKGLDLSEMRIRFRTQNADVNAPNTAWIRVYNLSDSTANKVQKEFEQVSLQAGYQSGNFGIIFSGQIMQTKRGREDALNSYVEIMAADGDLAHTYGFVNQSIKAGSTSQDRFNAMTKALKEKGVTVNSGASQALSPTGGVLARGKVLFGLAAPHLNTLCDTAGASWSIQNGVLQIIPTKGYRAGEAVVINAATGMVGVPEVTQDGINVQTLLNPLIAIGGRIKLDNRSLNQTTVNNPVGYPTYNSPPPMYANTNSDGIYRVLVAEHSGDTRGEEWFTDITSLSLDSSSGSTTG